MHKKSRGIFSYSLSISKIILPGFGKANLIVCGFLSETKYVIV
jgi:hypothetical protein